jgi:hypothetical protein
LSTAHEHCRLRGNLAVPIAPEASLELQSWVESKLMALELELETYKAKLGELSGNEGKFALIHADQVLGIFDTYSDAINEGYERVGLKPFLVKQIQAVERVQFVSRFVDPCPTLPSR